MPTNTPLKVVLNPIEAARYLGISRRTLDVLHEKDPTFPRKIHYSQRSVFFRRESLEFWLKQKEQSGA